jgi:hypothetical protein
MTTPTLLSFAVDGSTLYAAGPHGLFLLENGDAAPQPQPMTELTCCTVVEGRVLVGGMPHAVAFRRADGSWQAAWTDNVHEPALCFAPAPDVAESGVVLAGAAGGGILRSTDSGLSWYLSNFGMQDFNVLSLAWAPPAPLTAWPAWEVVFAGAENGLYRSPNGGRGWRRCEGVTGVVQSVAVATDFHTSGLVLAGAEADGLWRSCDGGRIFEHVSDAPERVDALVALANGWLLGAPDGVWQSSDGLSWRLLPDSPPALALAITPLGIVAGGEFGYSFVDHA